MKSKCRTLFRTIAQLMVVTVVVAILVNFIIIPYEIHTISSSIKQNYEDEIDSIMDYLDSVIGSLQRLVENVAYGYEDDIDILAFEIEHADMDPVNYLQSRVEEYYNHDLNTNFYYLNKSREVVYSHIQFPLEMSFNNAESNYLFDALSDPSQRGRVDYGYDENSVDEDGIPDFHFYDLTEADHLDIELPNGSMGRIHICGVDSGYVVSIRTLESINSLYDNDTAWELLLDGLDISVGGFFAAGSEDGKLLYCQDKVFDELVLVNPQRYDTFQEVEILGQDYYIQRYPYGEAYIYAITPKKDILKVLLSDITLLVTALVIAIVLVFAHGVLLGKEKREVKNQKRIGKLFYDKSHANKYFRFGGITFISLILIVALLLNVNSFIFNSTQIADLAEEAGYVYHNYKNLSSFDNFIYYDAYLEKLETVNEVLGKNETLWNKNDLQELAGCISVEYITIFDSNGKTVATSSPYDRYAISSDPADPSYECHKVLMGMESLMQEPYMDEFGDTFERISLATRDENGVANGFVQIGVMPFEYAYPVTSERNTETLFAAFSDERIHSFAIDGESGEFIYFPDENYHHEHYSSIGLSEDALEDGYVGFHTLLGKEVQIAVTEYNNDYFITVIDYKYTEVPGLLDGILLILLYLVAIGLIFCRFLLHKTEVLEEKQQSAHNASMDEEEWVAEEIEKDIDKSTRKTILDRWQTATAEQKMSYIVMALWRIIALVICFSILFRHRFAGARSIITFIYDSKWEKGFNLYAVVASIILASIVSLVTWIIKHILILVSGMLDARGETVSRLLGNMVKYIGNIYAAFQIAMYFGFNATTAIASLGVVSMALGFGAKDMITDIVAGVFILFEGTYKVGDMLLVNGEWCWVKSIGVRTTRLNAWGQIKTINNSQMTGIVNITNADTRVCCDITVSNEYPLEYIEEVLNRELPNMKSAFPKEHNIEPKYKGVQEIFSYGYTVRIAIYTPVFLQGWLGRELRRQVLFMLQKNDIKLANVEYSIQTTDGNGKESVYPLKVEES